MPKTGGTFVSYYLQDNILGSNYFGPGYGHQSVSSQRLNYPKHFMFGTIRNPWDWYLSFYEHQKKDNGRLFKVCTTNKDKSFNCFLINLLSKEFNKKNEDILFYPPGDSDKLCVPKFKYLSNPPTLSSSHFFP